MASKNAQIFMQKLNANQAEQAKSSIALYVKSSDLNKDYSSLAPIKSMKSPIKDKTLQNESKNLQHIANLRNSNDLKASKSQECSQQRSIYNNVESFLNEEEKEGVEVIESSQVKEEDEQPNIKCYVANLRLELNEAYKTIEAVKDALVSEKCKTEESEKSYKEKEKQRESTLKKEFEELLEQRLKTIEGLVNDKEELMKKMKSMKESKTDSEKIHEKKIKEIEERHVVEIKKAKEAVLASEKIRRDKWVVEKTEEIKKTTLKGIEPEVARIVAKHKQDIINLEEKHSEEIKNIKEIIIHERDTKIEEIKKKTKTDNEDMLSKEREQYEERIKQQYQRNEEQLNEQKIRWKDTLNEETQRIETLRKKDQEQHTTNIENNTKVYEDKIKTITQLYEDKLEELKRKHEIHTKELKEQHQTEHEEWQKKTIEKQKQELKTKLKQAQEQMTKDRNHEIELIVNKLGSNTNENKKKIINEYEDKILKLTEKYSNDNETATKSLEKWESMCASLKSECELYKKKINEITEDLKAKDHIAESKQTEVNDLNDKISLMNYKITNVDLVIGQKVNEALRKEQESMDKQSNVQKEQIYKIKEDYEKKIALLEEERKKQDKEKTTLSEKIMAAIDKREKAIKTLKEELCIKDSQIQKYVELLEKQRKDILKPK